TRGAARDLGIRVVASDIGGTLARSDRTISSFAADVIRRLIDQGVHVALLSGYNLRVAGRYRDMVDRRVVLAAQNGAIIVWGEDVLETNYLSLADARKAIELFISHRLSPAAFMGLDDACKIYYQPVSTRYDPAWGLREVEDLGSFLTRDPVQISAFDLTPKVQAAEAEARAVFGERCNIVVSIGQEKSWVEVNHPRARKKIALETILARLGASVDETIYFGDNMNDVETLQAVRFPVAVENALPEVRRLAWRVAPPNDSDGVARVLADLFGL
ncbi:MAG: Cof-type HAD-IIB family hydrolase, partial [Firmicutes bacterium]|nr:Cof-type HAD-IIB family hydrolase [Bacillota bacterium]